MTKFKKEDMLEMVYCASDRFVKIEEEIVDTSRWSIIYSVIFKDSDTNKYYGTSYSVGATESQDESPFEYDGNEIECYEVIQKEVTVKKWVKVD